MSGDLANSVETVVANHVVPRVGTYVFAVVRRAVDTILEAVQAADCGRALSSEVGDWRTRGMVAGWQRVGRRRPAPDSRTAVAVDPSRKLLFLAVGENISPRLILQELADLGAQEGMLLDGGGSSSMAIGKGATGISAGILYGGWRPVATHFGVRAQLSRLRGDNWDY
jgi:hypothetical protein